MNKLYIYTALFICFGMINLAQAMTDTEMGEKLKTLGITQDPNNRRSWEQDKAALRTLCDKVSFTDVSSPLFQEWKAVAGTKPLEENLVELFKEFPALMSYPTNLVQANLMLKMNTYPWVRPTAKSHTPEADLAEKLFAAWFLQETQQSLFLAINKEQWNSRRTEWNENTDESKTKFLKGIVPENLFQSVFEAQIPIKVD